MGTWLTGSDVLRVQDVAAARQGKYDRARKSSEAGIQRARSLAFPHREAQLVHAYGLLERQQGYHAAVGSKLAEALAIFERLGATKDSQRLRKAITESLVGVDDCLLMVTMPPAAL